MLQFLCLWVLQLKQVSQFGPAFRILLISLFPFQPIFSLFLLLHLLLLFSLFNFFYLLSPAFYFSQSNLLLFTYIILSSFPLNPINCHHFYPMHKPHHQHLKPKNDALLHWIELNSCFEKLLSLEEYIRFLYSLYLINRSCLNPKNNITVPIFLALQTFYSLS